MNVVTGLERVREMLASNGALPATLATVDGVIENAERLPGGGSAQATMLQLIKMLMRTPAANKDVRVYNDLAKLEEQMVSRAEAAAQERAAVVDRPLPKDKFYKAQREREKAAKKS